ncbi:MerR family transcriptional regulator [Streptomyces sp. DH37]|uniref:MerR family transcriptional regulator n=1 Tax=Streptomyces sp. DH37 TaxID=3040122 RepID=UPI002442E323|nr:MerR family transcriptional regulator [Streptomyces sp. DH37]MDG9701676.1 MerR family transcriptional regulator [Streptomyces sp. DH37]
MPASIGEVRFPNPPVQLIKDRDHLGDVQEAARIAGVKPDTIRIWKRRRKIEPVDLGDDGPELFHLPTVYAASLVKRGRPPEPREEEVRAA